MNPRSIGIVGYGNFGSFVHALIQRFAPQIEVRVYSRNKAPDGATFFSLPEVAECDAVIFAVPIQAYAEVLKETIPLMKKDGVIVDVATVKKHTVKLLQKLAGSQRYIAMHPMFGPESYQKRGQDVSGLRIVIAEHTLARADFSHVVGFLKSCGFSVIEMTADEHDKHLAESLFLTHFIGQTIFRAGFDRTEIDTVSFGFLMSAVESVRQDTALFQEVFRFNPYCKKVLKQFEKAERQVEKLLSKVSRA